MLRQLRCIEGRAKHRASTSVEVAISGPKRRPLPASYACGSGMANDHAIVSATEI